MSLEEDFEVFINTRLDNNYYKLLKINDFKEIDKKLSQIQKELLNNLETNQKKKLEKSIILRNSLANYEIYLAYKLGFCDFLKIIK